MLFVLLAFVVYNNLLNLGQSWILVGLVSFGQFLLMLHGGVLMLATLWLAKRHYNWTFRPSRSPESAVFMPIRALQEAS